MVNRGKPSRDCQPCKKRKLRCDLQADVCGQCSRAGIRCFGRRDPNELIILDQTASTKQKVLASHHHPLVSDPAARHHTSPFPQTTSPVSKAWPPAAAAAASTAIPNPIFPALEVRARNVFFSHYVFGFSRSHGALAGLYQATAPDSPLSAAVDAAALLFLAKHYQAPGYATPPPPPLSWPASGNKDLTRLATAHYVVATKRLGCVLRAGSSSSSLLPDENNNNNNNIENAAASAGHPVHGDETLQAVLVLDLYEKLAVAGARIPDAACSGIGNGNGNGNGSGGRGAWMSHVRGALGLVRAYGLKHHHHLASPVKRGLAARLATALVISCGAAEVHVPRELERLRRGLAPYFTTRDITADDVTTRRPGQVDDTSSASSRRLDPKFAVTGLVVGVVDLAADVGHGGLLTADEVGGRAQTLDRNFVEMERDLPPSWHCERRSTVGGYHHHHMVYGGYYDLYRDHFVAQVRNVIRTMRLLLAKMALKYCDITDTSYGGHRDATNLYLVIEQLCDEIVASVPQFTWTRARPENGVPFAPLQSLQCFTLLSPLYAAGHLTMRTELRDWIITTLEYMAASGGLHVAKAVANILRKAPETNYWHVYSMLGSYAFAA